MCGGTIQQPTIEEPVRPRTPIHAAVAGFEGCAADITPFTTDGNVFCHQAMYIIATICKYYGN